MRYSWPLCCSVTIYRLCRYLRTRHYVLPCLTQEPDRSAVSPETVQHRLLKAVRRGRSSICRRSSGTFRTHRDLSLQKPVLHHAQHRKAHVLHLAKRYVCAPAMLLSCHAVAAGVIGLAVSSSNPSLLQSTWPRTEQATPEQVGAFVCKKRCSLVGWHRVWRLQVRLFK